MSCNYFIAYTVIHLLGGGDSKGGVVLKYAEETDNRYYHNLVEIGYYFVRIK